MNLNNESCKRNYLIYPFLKTELNESKDKKTRK